MDGERAQRCRMPLFLGSIRGRSSGLGASPSISCEYCSRSAAWRIRVQIPKSACRLVKGAQMASAAIVVAEPSSSVLEQLYLKTLWEKNAHGETAARIASPWRRDAQTPNEQEDTTTSYRELLKISFPEYVYGDCDVSHSFKKMPPAKCRRENLSKSSPGFRGTVI